MLSITRLAYLSASVLPALLIAGCQSQDYAYSMPRSSSYTVALHQALPIAPERARIFLQNGKVIGKSELDQYQPHCGFEVRKLMPVVQTIESEDFVVSRVQHLLEEVVMLLPVQVASLQVAGLDLDSSPSDIFRGYHFWFASTNQPDVMRMTCRGVFAEPWQAYPPTMDEIAVALGDVATLRLE